MSCIVRRKVNCILCYQQRFIALNILLFFSSTFTTLWYFKKYYRRIFVSLLIIEKINHAWKRTKNGNRGVQYQRTTHVYICWHSLTSSDNILYSHNFVKVKPCWQPWVYAAVQTGEISFIFNNCTFMFTFYSNLSPLRKVK